MINLTTVESEELSQDNENTTTENIAFPGFPYNSNFLELSNGLNMHYLDEGSGDPIVLLHGVPTSSYLWRNIIPELADNARVIVPDLANFGLSDKTDEPLNFVEHGELIAEFIESLGLEDITLVGHDWGGPIGLTYAVDNPDNIAAIAYFESPVVPLPNVDALKSLGDGFFETFIDPANSATNIIDNNLFIEGYLFNPLFGAIAETPTDAEKAVYREPFLNPEDRQQLLTFPLELPILDTTGHPTYDPDGVGGDPPQPVPNINEFIGFANYLATTNVPQLLVVANPGLTPRELIQPLASQIPGLEIQEVGDATRDPAFHFLQEDVPEELSAVLGEWYDTSVATTEPEPDSDITLQITIESLAPENGIGIAQTWYSFHDGSFDLYNTGETASRALEIIAEDGITGIEPITPGIIEEAISFGAIPANFPAVEETVAGEFNASNAGLNGGTQGMVFTDNREPPFFLVQDPGQTISTTVTIDRDNIANNRFFSYGTMLFPTNDGFLANDDPQEFEIFDENNNFIGADFTLFGTDVLDAGTEVNDEDPTNVIYELDVIGNSIDENGTIQSFSSFKAPGTNGVLDFEVNGEKVFANSDFTVPDYPIARITVTEVTEPTEPETPLEDIINLTGLSDRSVTMTIARDAFFNNVLDLYEINADGSVTDATGTEIAPGETGYQEAAIANRLGLDLKTANRQTTDFDTVLEGDKIYAPLILVNGEFAQLDDSDSSNDPFVFFGFAEANVDNFDHIKTLEANSFGFEDLFGGGDADFNDMTLTISGLDASETPEPELEPNIGTTEADIIEVIGSNELIFAGGGNDLIDASASEGNNRIFGGTGDDTFILGGGDVLTGDAGEDRFFNQAAGGDRLTGGADADQFWIAVAEIPERALTITDFELDLDVIGISGIGVTSISDLGFTQNGDDTVISFDDTQLAIIVGIDSSSLEGDDNFIFA